MANNDDIQYARELEDVALATYGRVTTYVVFVFSSTQDSEPILATGRNPVQTAKSAPSRAVGFYYFDVHMGVSNDPIADASTRHNRSKTYWIDGTVLDASTFRDEYPSRVLLLENMIARGTHVVLLRNKRFDFFHPERHETVLTT